MIIECLYHIKDSIESWYTMKSKKILIDILTIIFAFTLFILWYNKNEKENFLTTASLYKMNWQANSLTMKQNYKIYLITKDKELQYWHYINQGAADMSALLGMTYTWDSTIMSDTDKQIEIFNNAINAGADAILIAPNDAEKLSAPIKNGKAKEVKIIYVDTPANEEAITTLATNNYDAGKIAGENMIMELELLGIQKGKIGILGINRTTTTTMQRELGFRDTINKDGRYTLLDTAYTEVDPVASQEASARMINEHKNLVGLFATNEKASVGVGNAIKADNNRIVGIGFDKSDAMMKQLSDESLKVIIAQNPYTMGYLGTAQAYTALKGDETGPSYIDTGVSVLRKR